MTSALPDIDAIRKAATIFRAAIELTDFSAHDSNLRRFPMDCCHHAALLLRLYLFDFGLGLFDKTAGQRPDGRQHIWLKRRDIVVDITADQFDEAMAKVIVTQDSPWHAAWEIGDTEPTDEAMIERSRIAYTEDYPIYDLILSNLSQGGPS